MATPAAAGAAQPTAGGAALAVGGGVPGHGQPFSVTYTPSETEAMLPLGSEGELAEERKGVHSPLQKPLQREPSGNPMRPVYSSDSLMALAAQQSFSGLGASGDSIPAYPQIRTPQSALRELLAPALPPAATEPASQGSTDMASLPPHGACGASADAPSPAAKHEATTDAHATAGELTPPLDGPFAGAALGDASGSRPVRSSRGHRRARSDEGQAWSASRRPSTEEEEGERLGRGKRSTNKPKRHHAGEEADAEEEESGGTGRANASQVLSARAHAPRPCPRARAPPSLGACACACACACVGACACVCACACVGACACVSACACVGACERALCGAVWVPAGAR